MWGFPRGFPNVIKLLSILFPHKGYYSPSAGKNDVMSIFKMADLSHLGL